jgi:CDP-6-deoxy-D-xylo-4-hexulose-3-dehydrase
MPTMKNSNQRMWIPYALSVHGTEEADAVARVIREHKTALGVNTEKFEKSIARLFGKKAGVMVNSGSSANLLAVELLDPTPGTEVITPLLTFSTTVAPLVQKGLVPVFTDVEMGTYLINVDQIQKLISKKTRALMVPSLIGNVPDMERLRKIADWHNLYFVEDSCDTLGARFKQRPTGVYSDISTTSFYGSHIINAAGGGGMICVSRTEWAKRATVLRGWGRSSALFGESEDLRKRFRVRIGRIPYDAKFIFTEIGYNFLPLEISAAFGLEQLKKLRLFAAIRKRNFERLLRFFRRYEELFVLPRQAPEAESSWLAFPLTISEKAPFTRREITAYLEKHNIQTRPVFTGNILRQPAFREIARKGLRDYPVTNSIMERAFLIGCHQGLQAKHLDYVEDVVESFLKRF